MRTTIEMPDPLFRAAKRHALNQGITLKQFVTAAVERGLKNGQPARRKRTVTAPFVKVAPDAPILRMTPQELKNADVAAEVEHYRAVFSRR